MRNTFVGDYTDSHIAKKTVSAIFCEMSQHI